MDCLRCLIAYGLFVFLGGWIIFGTPLGVKSGIVGAEPNDRHETPPSEEVGQ